MTINPHTFELVITVSNVNANIYRFDFPFTTRVKRKAPFSAHFVAKVCVPRRENCLNLLLTERSVKSSVSNLCQKDRLYLLCRKEKH